MVLANLSVSNLRVLNLPALSSPIVSRPPAKFPRAGEGNRTLVFSLEGYGSTIELHPRSAFEAVAKHEPEKRSLFPAIALCLRVPVSFALPSRSPCRPVRLAVPFALPSRSSRADHAGPANGCDGECSRREMGGAGFEPAKALPSDLQSDPFDRSGNPPGPSS
jgi:hypothetical protein